jgi:hypothetical protein
MDTSDDVGENLARNLQVALSKDLTPLEAKLVAGAVAGEPVDGGEGPFNLRDMKAWGEERTVQATVLQLLLVAEQWPVGAKGIRLRGARITGRLDLEAAKLRCSLSLDHCCLDPDEPVCLNHATALRVILTGCQLAGVTGEMLTAKELDLSSSTLEGPLRLLNADIGGQLNCSGAKLNGTDQDGNALVADLLKAGGGVFLHKGFTTVGAVRLSGANITGPFSCSGAKLNGSDHDGNALIADGLKAGDVLLDKEFTTAGAVRLYGVNIAGQLSCSGAKLNGIDHDGYALFVSKMKVGANVNLDDGFAAAGAVRMVGADITGQLECHRAQLNGSNEHGDALWADGLKAADVFLDDGFVAAGGVRLAGADITGGLSCSDAYLVGCDSDLNALIADNMKVSGMVSLRRLVTTQGAVSLAGADITGDLSCSGARLLGRDGDGNALIAARLKTGGAVHLHSQFTAAGALQLSGADITGELSCRGAELTANEEGYALDASGLKVGGDVFLDGGFTATGTVSFESAHAGGLVVLGPGEVGDTKEIAFNFSAARAQIAGALQWLPTRQVSGVINLEGASAGELEDAWGAEMGDKRANGYWPVGGQLRLDGFTYGRFGGNRRATVKQRLAWIRSQYMPKPKPIVPWSETFAAPVIIATSKSAEDFTTQPYEQLAAVYRHAGQDSQAREVAIARRADLRTYGDLNWYRRFGNWFLDITIKYGYQTWRAGVALAGLFAIFVWLSFLAQQNHLIIPVGNTQGLHPVPSVTTCTSRYPCFYPIGYAVDTAIPIINVHQADNWGPDGSTTWGEAFVFATWIWTGLGWGLATLLVAGYSGLVRQN